MDLVCNLFSDLAKNKITKQKIERSLDLAVTGLDKALEVLKSDKVEEKITSLCKVIDKQAAKDYAEGKISEKVVADAKKVTVLLPSPLSDAMYTLMKAYLAAGQSSSIGGENPNQSN
jgi:hypothetical protein